jgi:hypothetical protein
MKIGVIGARKTPAKNVPMPTSTYELTGLVGCAQ